MTDLLTKTEYRAIAKQIDFPSGAFINGHFQSAISGETFDTINPATGEVLTQVASCAAADVHVAVEKASEVFEQGVWSQLHPLERKKILIKLAKLMKRNRYELAVLESLDSGKPILDCQTVDIPESIETIIWHAEMADKCYDQAAPNQDDVLSVIVREPIGVVACVLPWNFPLLMLAWKMAPALATGNSVIIKPAEQTSLTALRVAELALEAGIPRAVFSVVTGTGEKVGEPLGLHPQVDMVSFTGSTITGKRFLRYSADSNLKKVVLECGGKNPAVVLNDAENLDWVAKHIVNGAYWNMGQNCSASSRLIVESGIKDKLIDKIKAQLKSWRMGDPLNPANHLGAMVSRAHFDKVCSYLKTDNILLGGHTQDDCFIEPTIIDDTTPDAPHATEEIFGPVLSVITVDSLDEAITIANAVDYGLCASVYTANGKKALRAAKAIRAGTVTINCYGEGDLTTPFGGYKQSGFGGRDNGIHAHDQYTELKTIWIDLSDDSLDNSLD